MALPFVHPSTILISGPTGCGKTKFVQRVISQKFFTVRHNKIYWIYSEWQPAYDQIANTNLNIEFHKDFTEDMYDSLSPSDNNLVILDDQMSRVGDSKILEKLFTEGSHHRSLSIIYIVQNLFDQGKSHRTTSLNTQYMILFKNPRDASQVKTLSHQMFPKDSKFLVAAFEYATRSTYGYLLLDNRPETPPEFRVRTQIFPGEEVHVYLPPKGIKGCSY